jgi:hypothetical protein
MRVETTLKNTLKIVSLFDLRSLVPNTRTKPVFSLSFGDFSNPTIPILSTSLCRYLVLLGDRHRNKTALKGKEPSQT